MRRLLGIFLAVAVAVALGACSSDGVDVTGSWRPTKVPGVELPSNAVLDEAVVTFHRDGSWRAAGGCGWTFGGEWSVEDDRIRLSQQGLASGECDTYDDGVPYDALLRDVATVDRPDDETLRLLDSEGHLAAEFRAVD